MSVEAAEEQDDRYYRLLEQALESCARYKPKFGRGRSGETTIEQFQSLYGADPFYHWVGLDSPLMYAAHKAAGGMTSIYRQLGIGCQWILNSIMRDNLGLSAAEATWSYQVPSGNGNTRMLSLDGRIEPSHVQGEQARARVQHWIEEVQAHLRLDDEARQALRGAVFEMRQGYKSKDAKRQNADIANAANAYASRYIPVIVLFSLQIDGDLALRYEQARWLLLRGTLDGPATESTYAFCKEVLGYDLAGFFQRRSSAIRQRMEQTLATLLSP